MERGSLRLAAGLIARSPCHDVSLPKVEQDGMRFLTPAEIARIADAMDDRWRVLVLVAAYAGLRIGELAGLRRRDVDVMRGTVTVARVVVDAGTRRSRRLAWTACVSTICGTRR